MLGAAVQPLRVSLIFDIYRNSLPHTSIDAVRLTFVLRCETTAAVAHVSSCGFPPVLRALPLYGGTRAQDVAVKLYRVNMSRTIIYAAQQIQAAGKCRDSEDEPSGVHPSSVKVFLVTPPFPYPCGAGFGRQSTLSGFCGNHGSSGGGGIRGKQGGLRRRRDCAHSVGV